MAMLMWRQSSYNGNIDMKTMTARLVPGWLLLLSRALTGLADCTAGPAGGKMESWWCWNHYDFIDDDHDGHNHDNGLVDCTKRSSQSNKVLMGKWSFSGKWLSSLICCRDALHMRGGCDKSQVNFRRRFSKLLNTNSIASWFNSNPTFAPVG